ncbi:MAG: hypothetical protein HUJ25_12095 [Crocinitomicaceae bacterium]|nr:hypothetical protein [Crocinitomicaceae bacterium]
MIRAYFDSDVINGIREGNQKELADLISTERDKLLIPFSMAHVYDKIPSLAKPELFWRDIDFITEITEKKLFNYDNKKLYTKLEIATARELYEAIAEGLEMQEEFTSFDKIINYLIEESKEMLGDESDQKLIEAIDKLEKLRSEKILGEDGTITGNDIIQQAMDFSNALQNNAEAYRENRNLMREQFLLPTNASNWNEDEAFSKIDREIQNGTDHDNFLEFIEEHLNEEQRKDRFLYYVQAYTMLGNIGYHADKIDIKRNKGLKNHMYDGMHSFFGAHADYFVVLDSKMRAKSKALYRYLNLDTKVVSPDEFYQEMQVAYKPFGIKDALKILEDQEPVDYRAGDEYQFLFRTGCHFLGYFTHIQFQKREDGKVQMIFANRYTNYSRLLFFEEFDDVIKNVQTYMGLTNNIDSTIQAFHKSIQETGQHQHDYIYQDEVYGRLFTNGQEFYLTINLLSTG